MRRRFQQIESARSFSLHPTAPYVLHTHSPDDITATTATTVTWHIHHDRITHAMDAPKSIPPSTVETTVDVCAQGGAPKIITEN